MPCWTRNEEYEVGVVYEVPGDQWRKYGQGVYSSLKSMEFLTGEAVADARDDLAEALAGKSGDARWLEEIKRKVVPGWTTSRRRTTSSSSTRRSSRGA